RRVVHLRKGRNGELLVSDRARDEQAHHQQRRRDRPQDEGAGRAHFFFFPDPPPGASRGARPPAALPDSPPGDPSVTFVPGCSLSTPSVTTVSPAAIPLRTTVSSPCVTWTSTFLISTLASGLTT